MRVHSCNMRAPLTREIKNYYHPLLLLSEVRRRYSVPLSFAHRGAQYSRKLDFVDLDYQYRSF